MNKEHLETDLTIKAYYKVGHILELTHLQIATFSSPESRIHTFAWEDTPEKQECLPLKCPVGSSIKTRQLYFLLYLYDH